MKWVDLGSSPFPELTTTMCIAILAVKIATMLLKNVITVDVMLIST